MENEEKLNPPQILSKEFDRTNFDCESEPLNDYMKKFAWQNQKKNSSRTYVATRGNQIIGYYTLAFGSVSFTDSPEEISAGLGKYPIPIILLARLAVDKNEKGKGLGIGLLKDAMLRAVQASEIAGLRAILVHAKDENAKNFYEKFGFKSSPTNDFHLFLSIAEIKESLAK